MEIAVVIFSLIGFICFIVLLFDIVPCALTWISRIHIGQWNDKNEWKKAVTVTGLRWLKKTPPVPVNDSMRWIVVDRIRGRHKNKKIQSWQEASLLLAAEDLKIEEACEGFIGRKIDFSSGKWKEENNSVDSAMLAFAILSADGVDKESLRPAMESKAKMLLELSEKSGTVPYSLSVPDVRFVDTVGMICPFLLKYAKEYDCPKAFELAKKQLKEYLGNGVDERTGLPMHCFNKKTRAPLGVVGWGRGCGWLCIALADSLRATDESELRGLLISRMKELADKLLGLQLPDGGWSRQILSESTAESSATAIIGWFMNETFKATGDGEYKKSGEKAIGSLMSRTRRDGTIDYAQGDTKGIGFYSLRLAPMPAAQGYAMRIGI